MHTLILTLLLFCGFVSTGIAADGFFKSVRHIPLMEGLQEIEDETLVFDKPQGRIIEVFASLAQADPEAVRAYYGDVLPQFGWEKSQNGTYYREQEVLELDFEDFEGKTYLKITISPR